jgi:NADH-dependent fumarate reductase subunit D
MRVVIVGNGPAAASAIEAFRSVDRESELVVLTPERHPTYAPNCMENVIRGDISSEALFYKGGWSFYERHRVDLRLGKEAVRIDNRRKVVITKEGEEISYDKCLIAAGAYAFIPPIPGVDLEGVTTAKTLEDAKRIREWVVSGAVRRALVVGAGPIGLEDAETLRHMGVEVTVVEIFDRALPRMLDRQMGKIYGEVFQKEAGVRLLLEHQVVAFHGKGKVEAVEVRRRGTDRSEFIRTDMVIISAGVRPRTYLVEGTDIEVHRDGRGRPVGGILVNEYQQTSDPDVFAAGDVASGIDVWGNHRWIALFPTAQQSGYVAGFNLAGKKVRNPGLVDYNAVKTRTVTAGSGGLFEDAEEEIVVERGPYLVKVFLKEGKVRGYQFLGLPRGRRINPNNRLLKLMGDRIRTWEEKVLLERGLGLEASGVLFHFFLKTRRNLKGVTRRAVEDMVLRALANPSLDLPLYL